MVRGPRYGMLRWLGKRRKSIDVQEGREKRERERSEEVTYPLFILSQKALRPSEITNCAPKAVPKMAATYTVKTSRRQPLVS